MMARHGDPDTDFNFFFSRKHLKILFCKFAAECNFSVVWDGGKDLPAQGADGRADGWKSEQL